MTNTIIMRCTCILLIFLLSSCALDRVENPIIQALTSQSPKIQSVVQNLESHEVQIKLTTISKQKDSAIFKDFNFKVDNRNYFYPASTVKFPVAVLTLEKLTEENLYDLDTPFFVEGDSVTTTFRNEIRDIFAVSSNDTYNRLFEFLGQDYINKKLRDKGLIPSQISHRLETTDADELTTKPLVFIENDSSLITTDPIINKPLDPLNLNSLTKGKGFYRNGRLINEPMDFSEKNYLPISTIHNMMKRVFFAEYFPEEQGFDLSETQHKFLIETMSILPRDVGYDPIVYFDGYGKFFIYGDTTEKIPDHIKIYNKVGYAYGYLTDCAYIKDSKNNIEFILSATIHVNADEIYNDDVYEYDSIGLPFLAELGREIHRILIDR